MTTTTEHLDKIVAKCRANLALAAKRTPYRWSVEEYHAKKTLCVSGYTCAEAFADTIEQAENNAAYIAACAGAAEAGWRATIAAIESLRLIHAHTTDWGLRGLEAIVAAWPEELL